MTQTPASGPAELRTTPPMSSLSRATVCAVPMPAPLANKVARHDAVNGGRMVRMVNPPESFRSAALGSLEAPLSMPLPLMQAPRMARILKAGVSCSGSSRSGGPVMMWRVLAGLLVACGTAAPALAHHSFAAEFEADKTAELSGKIVQVWWNNPHIRYRLQVTRDGGATEDWELQ